jgi:dihydropteroate synthase
MIYKKLGVAPEDSINGTTILNTTAFLKNASIFRVHDVKEMFQLKQLLYS